MYQNSIIGALASFSALAVAQSSYPHDPPITTDSLIRDLGVYGPPIELVHLYYDEFPTGIAVSATGRQFSNYPGGLDANNTYRGDVPKYTIAELTGPNTERPYPSAEINQPPGGAINYTTYPPAGANYEDYLIGSQSCVIDSLDRLWILDTGRVLTPDGILVPASPGGPKLVGVDLATDEVFQTIVFPSTVVYADSYLNDVRFDLRPNATSSGRGVAYITDSSVEGRNGIVVVDLGTGDSWRHLDSNPTVHPLQQWVAFQWGVPLFSYQPGKPFTHGLFGSDGIALSADGETLFWKAVASRYLYSIPTARLRDNSTTSEVLAQQSIVNHGETGVTDGMETDTNGFIYHGNMEQNAVNFFNPQNGTDQLFVRDPLINWVDTFSTATDGYLYFTVNQLVFGSGFYPGTDRRQRPFALFRAGLPGNASKPILL
ncbi:major royal jelly protein [Polychaeton citri CBS 116435]|uniref:Major royal jelly protein n=1 Tax=Polychaeton citri CBS 116435 TaxID=1314669 RepID=A0A9P4QAA4_9PEZI|nr:major royal jelly protein [Polychaeton citri CBS 116435]